VSPWQLVFLLYASGAVAFLAYVVGLYRLHKDEFDGMAARHSSTARAMFGVGALLWPVMLVLIIQPGRGDL